MNILPISLAHGAKALARTNRKLDRPHGGDAAPTGTATEQNSKDEPSGEKSEVYAAKADRINIGTLLSDIRKRQNVQISILADKIKVKDPTLRSIFSGRSLPAPNLLGRILFGLGLNDDQVSQFLFAMIRRPASPDKVVIHPPLMDEAARHSVWIATESPLEIRSLDSESWLRKAVTAMEGGHERFFFVGNENIGVAKLLRDSIYDHLRGKDPAVLTRFRVFLAPQVLAVLQPVIFSSIKDGIRKFVKADIEVGTDRRVDLSEATGFQLFQKLTAVIYELDAADRRFDRKSSMDPGRDQPEHSGFRLFYNSLSLNFNI